MVRETRNKRGNWWTLIGVLAFCTLVTFGTGAFVVASAADDPVLVATSTGSPVYSGPGLGHMGESGAWNCDTGRHWLAGPRWGRGSANGGTLGTALPEGGGRNYALDIESFTQDRYYRVTLYSSLFGDLYIEYPFSAIDAEAGFSYPTGRYDPLGDPRPFQNGNLSKFSTGLWGGGGGAQDVGARVYMFCGINP